MEQVVKITWFAAILTSSFINLNDGHNSYKRWFACFVAKKSKIDHLWFDVIFWKFQGKGSLGVFCCSCCYCLHRVSAASNERYDLAKKCGVFYQSCSHIFFFQKADIAALEERLHDEEQRASSKVRPWYAYCPLLWIFRGRFLVLRMVHRQMEWAATRHLPTIPYVIRNAIAKLCRQRVLLAST